MKEYRRKISKIFFKKKSRERKIDLLGIRIYWEILVINIKWNWYMDK